MSIIAQAANQSVSDGALLSTLSWIPNWLRIAATVLTGGLITYLVRQLIERRKLKKALKSEIRQMHGINTCKTTMESRKKPSTSSGDYLLAKEVPPPESIPTLVFEKNIGNIGLLKSDEIQNIVEFYTKVLSYKGIISSIRAGEDVPEADQNELWEEIETLARDRETLFDEGWLDD